MSPLLYFYPSVFMLGGAMGVLGLILLFSLLIAYAYDEPTLLGLSGYVALMAALYYGTDFIGLTRDLVQQMVLVVGPTLSVLAMMWLLRSRTSSTFSKFMVAAVTLVALGLMALFFWTTPEIFTRIGIWAWFALVLTLSAYTMVQHHSTSGPWSWWALFAAVVSLAVAIAFLSDFVEAEKTYWPQVLMMLVQVPPTYLALVWRSRLLNESRLRSSAAAVTDPLTGLATSAVLTERVMRVTSRAGKAPADSALFLIEVQNWRGLVAELGEDFNEKLMLEAALRLRRAIGDNDLAARLQGGRFGVVAQGLAGREQLSSLATRLLVSGLRIDSPVLTGIEFKFRIVVSNLTGSGTATLPGTQEWLGKLMENFSHWPSSHRSRSILLVGEGLGQTAQAVDVTSDY